MDNQKVRIIEVRLFCVLFLQISLVSVMVAVGKLNENNSYVTLCSFLILTVRTCYQVMIHVEVTC